MNVLKLFLKETTINNEYENYAKQYAQEVSVMSDEQLKEEYANINSSGLSGVEKMSKYEALRNEYKKRNLG